MPVTRQWKNGPVIFEAPYFSELLSGQPQGCLPRELGAHALWHYFCVASKGVEDEKQNLVAEDAPSIVFRARQVFVGIANMHGVSPEEMGGFWGVVEKQRLALGLTVNADLPERFKFRTRSN